MRLSQQHTNSHTHCMCSGVAATQVWPRGLFGTRWPRTLRTSFLLTSRTRSSLVRHHYYLVLGLHTHHTYSSLFDVSDEAGNVACADASGAHSVSHAFTLADWLIDRRWASLDFRDAASDIRKRINAAIQVWEISHSQITHDEIKAIYFVLFVLIYH